MPRRKRRNKGGRPCRYTPFVVTSIMAALARGDSLEEAADAAGIGTTTLYRWLALSRAGDARFARLAEAVDAVHHGSLNGQMVGHLLAGAARGGRSVDPRAEPVGEQAGTGPACRNLVEWVARTAFPENRKRNRETRPETAPREARGL